MKINLIWISFLLIFFIYGCNNQPDEIENVGGQPATAQDEEIIPPVLTIIPEIENTSTEITKEDKVENEELNDYNQYGTDEPHWTHMPVTYHILKPNHQLKDCGQYESNKIRKGFGRIEDSTFGNVEFKEINNPEDADIVVKCSYIKDCYELKTNITENYVYQTEIICEHVKGFANITESEGNKILKAEIEMIGLFGFSETRNKGPSGFFFASCGHPTVEIHEILHTFGYGHEYNSNSIMYFEDDVLGSTKFGKGNCIGSKKEIDDLIVDDLIKIYSK